MSDMVRVTVDVSPGMHAKFSELRALFGEGEPVSQTEALRRAVLFARTMLAHARAGGVIVLRNADGTEKEAVLL